MFTFTNHVQIANETGCLYILANPMENYSTNWKILGQ